METVITTLEQHASNIKRAMREIEKGFQVIAKELTEAKKQFDSNNEFEVWASEEFGFKKAHIHRLLSAQKVLDVLEKSPMGDTPQTERQTRELAKIKEPDDVIKVWKNVTDEYKPGEITAKKIKEVRERVLETPQEFPLEVTPDEFTITLNGTFTAEQLAEELATRIKDIDELRKFQNELTRVMVYNYKFS